nr:hypothetical protein CFP56_32291 [Quercus suber]
MCHILEILRQAGCLLSSSSLLLRQTGGGVAPGALWPGDFGDNPSRMHELVLVAVCLPYVVRAISNATVQSSGRLSSDIHTSADVSMSLETTSPSQTHYGTTIHYPATRAAITPSYIASNSTLLKCTAVNEPPGCWILVTAFPILKATRTELLPDTSTIIPMNANDQGERITTIYDSGQTDLSTPTPSGAPTHAHATIRMKASGWLEFHPETKSTQTELFSEETVLPMAPGYSDTTDGDAEIGSDGEEIPANPGKMVTSQASASDSILVTEATGTLQAEIAAPLLTVAGAIFTVDTPGGFVIGSQTLMAGSPALTVGGTTYSLSPAGSNVAVNGIVETIELAAIPSNGGQRYAYFDANGSTVTYGPTGVIIAGETLVPGSQTVLSSTTYSLALDQGVLVVNGVSESQQYVTHEPILTLGPNRYTENAADSGFPVGSQTLTLGGSLTVGSGSAVETLRMSVGQWGATEVALGTTSTVILADPSRATLGALTSTSAMGDGASEGATNSSSAAQSCVRANSRVLVIEVIATDIAKLSQPSAAAPVVQDCHERSMSETAQ